MFTDAVQSIFHVQTIACDSTLTFICPANIAKSRRNLHPKRFFHLKSARYCVGKHSSFFIYANLHNVFSAKSGADCRLLVLLAELRQEVPCAIAQTVPQRESTQVSTILGRK